ncbi:hypothetical protein HHA03_13160 [Halolactibacillus halophilus]|uniref:Uncharacterized protein n=1 Tax=Halolactibacillus halophilus TaxID=306540 RepID=A0ABQ0VL01_9BACI|nr:hypothetical protein HHA03_13160 [Halolactibacillus halophilus]
MTVSSKLEAVTSLLLTSITMAFIASVLSLKLSNNEVIETSIGD